MADKPEGGFGSRRLTSLILRLGAKRKQRQGRGMHQLGRVDGLVQGVDRVDGEDGPERLLGHHRVVDRVDQHGGGLDEELGLVHLPAHDDLAVGVVQHRLQTQEVALVDDAAQVGAGLGAVGERLLVGVLQLLDEGGDEGLVDQHIVVRQADLAGVQGLAPEQPLRRLRKVANVLGDDGGVPAAELEDHRGQRLGRLLGDDGADLRTTREEDNVPLLLHQRVDLGDRAVDDGEGRRVETLLDHLLDHHGAGRGQLGRLEHGGAARRDGADEGGEQQLDREVVRPDDERGAHRLLAGPELHHGEGPRHRELLVLGEPVEIVQHIHAVVLDPVDFGEGGLERALVQVLLQRGEELRPVVLHGPVQLPELRPPPFEAFRLVRLERAARGPGDSRYRLHGSGLERGDRDGSHGCDVSSGRAMKRWRWRRRLETNLDDE